MSRGRYVITYRHMGRWHRLYGCAPKCRLCNKELRVGEKIERRRPPSGKTVVGLKPGHRSTPKFYHELCLDEGSVPISDSNKGA